MRNILIPGTVICGLLVTGCVSSGTHKATLAELEEAKKSSTQTSAAFEEFKKKSAAEIEALEQEKTRLANELLAAQSVNTKTQQTLDETTKSLNSALQSRRELEAEAKRLRDENQLAQQMDSELRRERGALETQTAALQKEREQLMVATGEQESQLKQAEAEKARLEQERLAKEAEIQRLTQTHDDLTKQLQAEIEKGNIKIQQVADKLTINMLDQVLFDSGQAQIKPAGLKVLKQVSDIVKNVDDKQIRIEGHTDNVPIGGKLKSRFPYNWELSTARATSVVRYLIDEGGVEGAKLSAVGYAEMRPIASNDTDEGRKANRRIEIALYPKDLSKIASQIMP